jgi:hypothetical protein
VEPAAVDGTLDDVTQRAVTVDDIVTVRDVVPAVLVDVDDPQLVEAGALGFDERPPPGQVTTVEVPRREEYPEVAALRADADHLLGDQARLVQRARRPEHGTVGERGACNSSRPAAARCRRVPAAAAVIALMRRNVGDDYVSTFAEV